MHAPVSRARAHTLSTQDCTRCHTPKTTSGPFFWVFAPVQTNQGGCDVDCKDTQQPKKKNCVFTSHLLARMRAAKWQQPVHGCFLYFSWNIPQQSYPQRYDTLLFDKSTVRGFSQVRWQSSSDLTEVTPCWIRLIGTWVRVVWGREEGPCVKQVCSLSVKICRILC